METTQQDHLAEEQDALNELRAQASSAEDHTYLDDEQAKIEAAKRSLGHETLKLVEMPDGSFATKAEVEAWQGQGHNLTDGPYKGNRR